jgi:hypothetical protein
MFPSKWTTLSKYRTIITLDLQINNIIVKTNLRETPKSYSSDKLITLMVTLIEGVHQNPRHHNFDMKQVLYWGSTNIRRHCTPGARNLRVAGKGGSVSAARGGGGVSSSSSSKVMKCYINKLNKMRDRNRDWKS